MLTIRCGQSDDDDSSDSDDSDDDTCSHLQSECADTIALPVPTSTLGIGLRSPAGTWTLLVYGARGSCAEDDSAESAGRAGGGAEKGGNLRSLLVSGSSFWFLCVCGRCCETAQLKHPYAARTA